MMRYRECQADPRATPGALCLAERAPAVPLVCRLMSDQFTPVLAYRRLVAPDERTAPSFLFESVEDGRTVGRYSFIGSRGGNVLLAFGLD